MRVKIMMLAERERYREDLRASQQTLTAVAVAFGQSLIMKESIFGEGDVQDALEGVRQSDAVLALGSMESLERMALAMGCFAGEILFDHPKELNSLSRLKSGKQNRFTLVWPLASSASQLARTASAACAKAKECSGQLFIVPPEGEAALWNDAASKAAMFAALQTPEAMAMDEAISLILNAGEERQVFLCSADAARIIRRLSGFLGGVEALVYTTYLSETRQLYAVSPANKGSGAGLLAVLYATSSMIGQGLRLKQEGDCLKTAIDNVLASGWRTAEMELGEKTVSADEILRLVSEQIALAGELFERLH